MRKPKTIASKIVFANDILDLKLDQLTLDNNQPPYPYIYISRKQSGVVVIPYFANQDSVLLVSQYRHPLQLVIWGFPGGGIEKGQNAEQTAQKELLEETGYQAKQLIDLGPYYPDAGIIGNTGGRVFLALNPVKVGPPSQHTAQETTKPKMFKLSEVKKMISQGEIRDGWSLGPWSIFLLWLAENGTKETAHGKHS